MLEWVDVKIEKDGEILVKSKTSSCYYLNNPEETKKAFRNGWVYTGDIGEFVTKPVKNDDGKFEEKKILLIKGRKKTLCQLNDGTDFEPEILESYF